MTAYAFWNNKGGVGKSFLSFVAATEYAHAYPDTDVYVIDLCPQANISETLLANPDVIHKLIGQTPCANPRALPSERFIEIPDYHSACVMMTTTGIPSYHLQPGRNKFRGRQVQLEPEALRQFQDALASFVAYL